MTRIEPAELRIMADSADVNGMPQYAQALSQAAEDAEDAERFRHVREHTKALENFYNCEYSNIDSTVDEDLERQKRKEPK